MLRRSWIVLIVMLLSAGYASAAQPQPTLTLTDSTGDPSTVNLSPGDSFTITVTLTTPQPFTGLSFQLSAPGNGSSRFSITDRVADPNNPLGDEISTHSQIVASASALLDPKNNNDLGYSADDVSTNISPGSYVIETITIQTSNSLPLFSEFYIQVVGAVVSDKDFNEFPFSGGLYLVTTPEPTGLVLLLGPGLALSRRRRRRVL